MIDMSKYAEGESKYLKADQLKGKEARVTIESVHIETFEQTGKPDQEKPVLKFAGKDKLLVLNVTNVQTLVDNYGSMDVDWIGKEVRLFTVQTPMGLGIRLAAILGGDPDDAIPF